MNIMNTVLRFHHLLLLLILITGGFTANAQQIRDFSKANMNELKKMSPNDISKDTYFITREVPDFDPESGSFTINLKNISYFRTNTVPGSTFKSTSVYSLDFLTSDPHFSGSSNYKEPEAFVTPQLDETTATLIEMYPTQVVIDFNLAYCNYDVFTAVPAKVLFINQKNGDVYYEYTVDNSLLTENDLSGEDIGKHGLAVMQVDMVTDQYNEENEFPEDTSNAIHRIVDQSAEFPGGMTEQMSWIANNLTYPESTVQKGIEGRVVIDLVIEKDGSIGKVRVLKSVDRNLDLAAVRLAKRMPKWKPAKINGEPVRSYVSIPIIFKSQNQ